MATVRPLVPALIMALIDISLSQLRGRLDIPMGVPDLDDKYSRGLENYIGMALPGGSTSSGRPTAQGRSGFSGPADANSVSNLYNAFPMPELRPNYQGMTKWYGPDFQAPPPPGPQSPMNMGPMGPPMGPPPPQELPRAPEEPKRPNDGSIQVSDLTCQRDRQVIGLSNDRNHWLSTVECECRPNDAKKLEYYCYSLCDGPQLNQRCLASFSILNSCPTYSNCGNWTQLNDTTSGAISCVTGSPVPEAVCWILASAVLRADNRPLRPAFYASASGGCHMSCLCGNDGTVAGEFQCANTPASNWRFPVYPRNHKFSFDQPILI